jgi:hypothetical protein
MAGIESNVLATFLDRLKASDDVPAAVAERLELVLVQKKLPKPDELARLYRADGEGPAA